MSEGWRFLGDIVIVGSGMVAFWVWVQRTPSAAPPELKEDE
jgi:hypothetical protein